MLSASFDTYAHQYDEHFTLSPIGMAQRRVVHRMLMPLLAKNKHLLELNCGTGYDAVELAPHVKQVLATDASPGMIAECEARLDHQPNPQLQFKVLRIQDADTQLPGIDLVFSNFGGLNCLSPQEFGAFAHDCRDNLKPGAELFFVVMGRRCFWETLYFLWKFDKARAFRRRQRGGVPTRIGTAQFNTWYYSPKEISNFFGSGFALQGCGPVGLFVPPSYLNPFFEERPRLLGFFDRLDQFFCKFKWLSGYADHFYIHLKKTT